MRASNIDLGQLLSNSNGYLWETQQDLERLTGKLVEAREMYRVALLNYELHYSKVVEEIVESGKPITTAKEIAKNKVSDDALILSERKEVKRKLTIYYETVRERLNTIKYIGKETKPLRT